MKTHRPGEPTLFELTAETVKASGGQRLAPIVSETSTDPNGSADRALNPPGSDLAARSVPHLMDITALAERLGVTPRHIRRLVAERRVPFIKWGHLIRFDPAEIAEWLEQARIPTNDGA